MLRTSSIKTSILGILAVMGFSCLLLLAMVQYASRTTHRLMEDVSGTVYPAELQLKEAEALLEEVNKRSKDAVLLEDQNGLKQADLVAGQVVEAMTAVVRQLRGSPELSAKARTLETQFEEIHERSHQTYWMLLGSPENVSDGLQEQVRALARDNATLSEGMGSLDAALAERGRSEFEAIDDWSSRARNMGWGLLAVALAGCGGTWWVLHHKVVMPLENLARRMQDIAEGDGDLTDRVEVQGEDELDEVGRWFNVFIGRIEEIVLRVMENARALGDAATELAENARETASQTALQQEQAMRISGSMGEISTAAYAISENTQRAAGDARKAEEDAKAGGETIQSTVAMMQHLLLTKRANAAKIGGLGNASEEIGKVIQVIYEISNQAGLLALNASIEAARAGEQGRGFAVVAGEVRRLAESTSQATREIEVTVRAIQRGTAEVVEAMQATTRQVENGVGMAQSAGVALENIIKESEVVQRMVTQIASASSEQSVEAQSVNANLKEIAKLGTRTAASSAGAATACERLSHLAADLNGVVGSFKVREFAEGRGKERVAEGAWRSSGRLVGERRW